MGDIKALTEAIVEMQEDRALEMTKNYLDDGTPAMEIFEAYKSAMAEVGNRFEKQIYFIPELIMSGEMMKNAMEIIKPYLAAHESAAGNRIGKILLATVEGDIHDIGKNIAAMMLDLNGFEVRDLGVDVAADRIVDEAKAFGANIVGLSGLLTLAFDPMKDVVEQLAAAGMRDTVKVLIGGGQMDEAVLAHTGADAFVTDAVAGVTICKGWMN